MFNIEWSLLIVVILVIAIIAPLLAKYIFLVLTGRILFLRSIECRILKIFVVQKEMNWSNYLISLLVFNACCLIFSFIVLKIQHIIPLNQNSLPSVPTDVALNIIASTNTTTNWQGYFFENTISEFSNLFAIGIQFIIAPATGISVMAAFSRSFINTKGKIGNYWQDMFRSIFYIFLPIVIILAIIFIFQGSPQNINSTIVASTLEGAKQTIISGPAASHGALSVALTNGGHQFASNFSHPFANPNYISNLFGLIAIMLLPVSCLLSFGYLVRARKQVYAMFTVCVVLALISIGLGLWFEHSLTTGYIGSIWEGKELRFGHTSSVLWSIFTTLTGNGSLNNSIDTLAPLTSMITLINMLIDQVIFGGIGSGVYVLTCYAMVTVFLIGLMVGQSPQFLKKKIEHKEMFCILTIILFPAILIIFVSSIIIFFNLNQFNNIHDFVSLLYTITTASETNGSGYSGIEVSPMLNIVLAIIMLSSKYVGITAIFILSGLLSVKKKHPSNLSFATDNILFIIMLTLVLVFNLVLTHLPMLNIGNLLEHQQYLSELNNK